MYTIGQRTYFTTVRDKMFSILEDKALSEIYISRKKFTYAFDKIV